MNAYELYEAVFDSARSEYLPDREDGLEAYVEEVYRYAGNVFNLLVEDEVALLVAKAGYYPCESQNQFWHTYEKRLRAIELAD